MKEFFRSKKGRAFLAAAALLAGMMIFSARSGGLQTLPERILSAVLYPFQKASADLSDSLAEFSGVFIHARENYEERLALQQEVTSLREQLVRYQSLESENSRLREMLGIRQENPSLTLLDGAVIARTPEDFGAFTIDRGKKDGVSLYDPVMTADGLVGFIGELGTTTSRVVTLFSPECNVGAVSSETGDSGNVTGSLSLAEQGLTRMELIARDASLASGDLLITTGLTGSFPKGILIGTIESVELEENGISLWASIRPAADISGTSSVFIITDFPGKGEIEPGENTSSDLSDTPEKIPTVGSGE